jgi:hypothetical protein
MRAAGEHGALYELHFWGGISLRRPMHNEYRALREAGYPVVLRDLAQAVSLGQVLLEPTTWHATPARDPAGRTG